MLSFFFLLIYYGDIVFESFDVSLEFSILGEVIYKAQEFPSTPYF